MSVAEHDVPVVIVGAGPVGAVMALQLAASGVDSVVVERTATASRHPKMDFLNGRSMELLTRLGLGPDIRAQGVSPAHRFNFRWLHGLSRPELSEWDYPSVDETRAEMAAVNDGSQPREPYQRILGSRLEELGRARCAAAGPVDLRLGWSFAGLTQDSDGVTVELVDPEGGTDTVRARYVVGCDGANSAVRRAAGIEVDEQGPRVEHRDVYFRSTDPALHANGPFFLAILSSGLTLVSRDGDQTWTGTYPLLTEADAAADPVAVIRKRLGVDLEVDEVLAIAQWEGRLGVAATYRAGSVFLAGDAAHQFFPTGGHGANTGIGDAVDLGWKLAAVVSGWGGPALLDSYDAERRPVALFNREMCANLLEVWRRFPALAAFGATDRQLSGFLDRERYQISNLGIHFGYGYHRSPVIRHESGVEPPWDWHRIVPTTWPGRRLPSVRTEAGAELHDLLGTGYTLVDTSGVQAGKPIASAADALGVPLTYLDVTDERLREVLARRLVLVRPDQHVAWRGDEVPENPSALLELVTGK
ncbi:FAD-dependent monooxygenase [Kutzneria sp. NPDC051319]|uniref:FAD-dependent monooxygenase n=1 Tax=Kutzneria sp. NPDC051319 TaxID=3155047 RepID=UPI003416D3DE